jgi:uncharacterized membrane protein
MTAYTLVLVTHVLVAILGVGSIASIAFVTTTARRSGREPSDLSTWLSPLFRISAFSLLIMLITGATLDYLVGGAFHHMWWFRVSFLLLLVTGALHGGTRRTVRTGLAAQPASGSGSASAAASLRRVERLAYAMCFLIAAITALMEAKPF